MKLHALILIPFSLFMSCNRHQLLVEPQLEEKYIILKDGITDDYSKELLGQWDSTVIKSLPSDPVGMGDAIVLSYGPEVLYPKGKNGIDNPKEANQISELEEPWNEPKVVDCRSWLDTTNNTLYLHCGFFQPTTASVGAEINLDGQRFEIFLLESAQGDIFSMYKDRPASNFLRIPGDKQVLHLSETDIKAGDVIHGYLDFESLPYFKKQTAVNQKQRMKWNARYYFKIGVGTGTGSLEERFYDNQAPSGSNGE